MKRTPEKVLSVISLVITVFSGIMWAFWAVFSKKFEQSGIYQEIEADLYSDPTLTAEEVEMTMSLFQGMEGFSWVIVALLFVSIIATIVGMVFMWSEKNPKLAGVMFIVGGVFALVIMPPSIMLYIAGILCFTRKPIYIGDEPAFSSGQNDDSMRPL